MEDNQIDLYLNRINCPRHDVQTLGYLKRLHRQHMLNIPFENLDNFYSGEIILDEYKIFNKIVLNKRGGFCYELNLLFFNLLKSLAFDCYLISAQVYKENRELGPEFDHMAIIANVNNQNYLLDVGFGYSFTEPKILHTGVVQMDYNRFFKIEKTIDEDFILQTTFNSFTYRNEYIFSKTPRQKIEFLDMCHYHHTNPKSHLKQKIYVTQAHADGQLVLTDDHFTQYKLGKKIDVAVHNRDEFLSKLEQHFGIVIT